MVECRNTGDWGNPTTCGDGPDGAGAWETKQPCDLVCGEECWWTDGQTLCTENLVGAWSAQGKASLAESYVPDAGSASNLIPVGAGLIGGNPGPDAIDQYGWFFYVSSSNTNGLVIPDYLCPNLNDFTIIIGFPYGNFSPYGGEGSFFFGTGFADQTLQHFAMSYDDSTCANSVDGREYQVELPNKRIQHVHRMNNDPSLIDVDKRVYAMRSDGAIFVDQIKSALCCSGDGTCSDIGVDPTVVPAESLIGFPGVQLQDTNAAAITVGNSRRQTQMVYISHFAVYECALSDESIFEIHRKIRADILAYLP